MVAFLLLLVSFFYGSPAVFRGYEPSGAACLSIDLPVRSYANRWIVWSASPIEVESAMYSVTVTAVGCGYSISLNASTVWTCIADDPALRKWFSSIEGASETRWQHVTPFPAGSGTLLLLVD